MKISGNDLQFHAYDSKDGTSYKSELAVTGDQANISMGVCSVYMIDFLKKVDEEILQLSFPVGTDPIKPSYIMVYDGANLYYMLTSLIDFVHLPTGSTTNG
jgi:hypothetical protein